MSNVRWHATWRVRTVVSKEGGYDLGGFVQGVGRSSFQTIDVRLACSRWFVIVQSELSSIFSGLNIYWSKVGGADRFDRSDLNKDRCTQSWRRTTIVVTSTPIRKWRERSRDAEERDNVRRCRTDKSIFRAAPQRPCHQHIGLRWRRAARCLVDGGSRRWRSRATPAAASSCRRRRLLSVLRPHRDSLSTASREFWRNDNVEHRTSFCLLLRRQRSVPVIMARQQVDHKVVFYFWLPTLTLSLALVITVPHQIIWSWYTGRWWWAVTFGTARSSRLGSSSLYQM